MQIYTGDAAVYDGCMYVNMYGYIYSKSKDQSFKVTVSAVPSRPRVSLLISILKAESGAHLRDSSRFPRRLSIYLFKPPYANGSVPSLSGHAITYR